MILYVRDQTDGMNEILKPIESDESVSAVIAALSKTVQGEELANHPAMTALPSMQNTSRRFSIEAWTRTEVFRETLSANDKERVKALYTVNDLDAEHISKLMHKGQPEIEECIRAFKDRGRKPCSTAEKKNDGNDHEHAQYYLPVETAKVSFDGKFIKKGPDGLHRGDCVCVPQIKTCFNLLVFGRFGVGKTRMI